MVSVATYLRVSTEKQDEQMQKSAILRFIESQQVDKEIIEFKDFGISGTITERPGYQELLTKVMSGDVSHIYVYEYSRLWRDLEEQNRVLKILTALNVCLMSVTEGAVTTIEDKFKANVLGAANVYEAERLKRRIKDGIKEKQEKVAKGLDTWNGRGPDKKVRKRQSQSIGLLDRFWNKIDKKDDNGCWLWKAYKDKHGFGQFSYNGKPQYPHILLYESIYGKIAEDLYITHTCDNPSCCNPKHLKTETIDERFLRNINIKGNIECWDWKGSTDDKGYGLYSIDSKTFRAHRLAYESKYGEISNRSIVCHKCDNPSCVNLEHLFIGTDLDNCNDKIQKNRALYVCGELQGHSKLTDLQVGEIRKLRSDGLKLREIAEIFNIAETTVSDIARYKSRKRVTANKAITI